VPLRLVGSEMCIRDRYGESNLDRGIKMYVALRSMQMRPMRLPKPQVKRGTVI
jgi:hypothetical protein